MFAPSDVDALEAQHRGLVGRVLSQSFVEIPDKTLEKEYYASLYLLASVSRSGEQPPGLWGNWVMKIPAWNGDYTLNYNYEAPFYAAFPTNHVELADSYDQPVIDWVPNAQALATTGRLHGRVLPRAHRPLPNGSGDTNEWNQKFSGAFAVTDHDHALLLHARPRLRAQDLPDAQADGDLLGATTYVKDGTPLRDQNDAQHEGNAYPQTNGVMSLGLVRFLLQGDIDISTALGQDADLRATWQDRLTNLSAFPTFT